MSSGKTMAAHDRGQPTLPDQTQLWQWSLALYPAIKNIALQWQDQFGVNVNLLLLLLYLQRQQQKLSVDDIQQLHSAVALQQQRFTAPLRALRRQLPAHLGEEAAAAFKQQLLQTELYSEQLEQQQLIECLQGLNTTLVTAELLQPPLSLPRLYLQLLQVDATPLLSQVFDLDQAAAAVVL